MEEKSKEELKKEIEKARIVLKIDVGVTRNGAMSIAFSRDDAFFDFLPPYLQNAVQGITDKIAEVCTQRENIPGATFAQVITDKEEPEFFKNFEKKDDDVLDATDIIE